jgi:hypothetical protein
MLWLDVYMFRWDARMGFTSFWGAEGGMTTSAPHVRTGSESAPTTCVSELLVGRSGKPQPRHRLELRVAG